MGQRLHWLEQKKAKKGLVSSNRWPARVALQRHQQLAWAKLRRATVSADVGIHVCAHANDKPEVDSSPATSCANTLSKVGTTHLDALIPCKVSDHWYLHIWSYTYSHFITINHPVLVCEHHRLWWLKPYPSPLYILIWTCPLVLNLA